MTIKRGHPGSESQVKRFTDHQVVHRSSANNGTQIANESRRFSLSDNNTLPRRDAAADNNADDDAIHATVGIKL